MLVVFISSSLLFSFSPFSALCESYTSCNLVSTLKEDLDQINFHDVKKLFPGVLIGITVSLPFFLVDKYFVEKYVEDTEQNSSTVKLGEILSLPGYGLFIIPVALLGYSYGYLSSNDRLRRGFFRSSFNTITHAIVVQILKFSGRARPYRNLGSFYFEPLGLRSENRSFPSAHSQSASSFYFTLGQEICDSILCKGILFSIPPIVALGRVLAKEHWVSDVVAGIIIGASFHIF